MQPILSQIFDFCFYFPEWFSDFSTWKYTQEFTALLLENKISFKESVWPEIYKKCQK